MKLVLALCVAIAAPGCKRRVPAQEPEPQYPDAATRVVVAADAGVPEVSGADAAPEPAPDLSYLKGSTHVHTVHSGDSTATPGDVARWYAEREYDFIVITDHNRVTDFAGDGELLVLRGIELTNNPPSCEPAPPEPTGKCRIHVNSLFVTNFEDYEEGTRPPKIEWRERNSIERIDLYQAALKKTEELGGLAQLNHPTWHWGTDGALLAEMARRGMVLFEVANTAFGRWNKGTETYPGTEAIWDAALTEGALVYGVASDDAHHFDEQVLARREREGKSLYPAGGGWIMVRAEKTAESIRSALARGDFYASTGVRLDSASRNGDSYEVVVSEASEGEHTISLIETGGKVARTVDGRRAEFDLSGRSGYVRVVVRSSTGATAWTQPVVFPRAEQ